MIGIEDALELRKLFEAYFKLINGYNKSIGTAHNELHEDENEYSTKQSLEDFYLTIH